MTVFLTPLTFNASPLVSSSARSCSVKSSPVTSIPSAPDVWPANDRMVLSIPAPFTVTPSAVRLRLLVSLYLPAGMVTMSPGLASSNCCCRCFSKSGSIVKPLASIFGPPHPLSRARLATVANNSFPVMSLSRYLHE